MEMLVLHCMKLGLTMKMDDSELKALFSFLLMFLFPCPGNEDLPHVPLREHQCREQVERGREAGGEADRQGRSGI